MAVTVQMALQNKYKSNIRRPNHHRRRQIKKNLYASLDFEKEFGEVVAADPGKSPEAGKDTTHIYTHQASHRVFHLRFEDGVLLGYGSSHGPDDIQPYLASIEQRMKDIK